jgi:mannose/cellobiose epimerase-like protein (N-acyl-D-glucosamine 2-epimerase family)
MLAARVVVVMLLLAGAAAADDKVDAAKTQTCEKTKKFLADQKAKGKCAAEADEAAKLTCSPATYKPMSELLQKCTSAKPAPAAVTPKCRALDAGNQVIDEAEHKLAAKCSTALLEKLKKKWCLAENKGKSFPYTLDFDHLNGAKKMEPTKRTWTCRTVVK